VLLVLSRDRLMKKLKIDMEREPRPTDDFEERKGMDYADDDDVMNI